MRENEYQRYLIRELKARFPGCIVLKNDPSYIQGFPDLTVLHHDMWAVLEVKASADSPVQPNQEFYIDRLSEMSFSAFIYPENELEVLDALQSAFQPRRTTRISRR
jgi:hypothetical protein